MKKNDDHKLLLLAGLLHDIGKFYQRADEGPVERSVFLSAAAKNLEGQYCPVYDGIYSHKHVLWTAQFLIENESFYKELFGDRYRFFFEAAVAHHKPNENDLGHMIVQKADHYSSGVDRTGKEGLVDAQAELNWPFFKDVHMFSIFEGILKEKPDYSYRLPITPMVPNESILPVKASQVTPGQPAYQQLWNSFSEEVAALHKREHDLDDYIENILALLERYASFVPSSTQHLPDVSLFDHLITTGAFSNCLSRYLADLDLKDVKAISGNDSPILMIGGDLSGIQSYIYDIISSNAAKNLKGRSFYLQILIQNVIRMCTERLQLSSAHVIYSSGGVFYMLAPNTENVRDTYSKLRDEVHELLFSAHHTSLFLAMDVYPISQNLIMDRRIHEAWKGLTEGLNLQKRQRHLSFIRKDPARFFSPMSIGGKQTRDVITGEEFTLEEEADYYQGNFKLTQRIDGEPVRRGTYEQIELGKRLKNSTWWITSLGRLSNLSSPGFSAARIGFNNYFLSQEEIEKLPNRTFYADYVQVAAIRSEVAHYTGGFDQFAGSDISFRTHIYGGNDYPSRDDGTPVTFDQLAESGEGASKLGVLQMDVDGLGLIFQKGLDESHRTFSRYSTLSRQLDLFFNGYINTIWNRDPDFRRSVSIIYAGGDDMFLVGQWNVLIRFAKEVRESFRQFTCMNPMIGISGGMAIVNGKFPIFKAADMAGQAEKRAKGHIYQGIEKNAIDLFGRPLNWDGELNIVEDLKNMFVELVQQNRLPRGVLHKMMSYSQLAREAEKKRSNPKWIWHMAYDFKRASDRSDSEEARDFFREIKDSIFGKNWKEWEVQNSYAFLELLEVAARWAEMETKTV